MKKILLAFLICTTTMYSQTTKTFNDTYNEGEMIYSYYIDEETSEIIKHGNFKYTKNLTNQNSDGKYSLIVNGQFKHGQRNGAFKYSIILKDYPNLSGSYTTEQSSATLTYQDGIPNGEWKVNIKRKSRDLILKNGNYVWSGFSEESIQYAETNFKNAIATGKTSFKDFGINSTFNFNLNNNGFITGNYLFNGSLNIYDLKFDQNGVLLNAVVRNKSGKVEHKQDIDPELKNVVNDYKIGTLSKEEMETNRIEIDTLNNRLPFLDYNHIFEQEPFLFRTIGGDKTLSSNTSETSRIYKRYLDVKKIEYINLKEDIVYNNIINSPANKKVKLENLASYIEDYSKNISPEDKLRLNEELKDYKNSLISQEQNANDKTILANKKEELKQILNEIDVANMFTGKFSDIISEIYKKENDSLNKYKQILITNFNLSDNESSGYISNRTREKKINYSEKLKEFENQVAIFNKKNKTIWNKISRIKVLAKNADLDIFKIKCFYEDFTLPGYYAYKSVNKNTSLSTYKEYSKIYKENFQKTNLSDNALNLKTQIFNEYKLSIGQFEQNINEQNSSKTFEDILNLNKKLIEVNNKLIDNNESLKKKLIKTISKTEGLNNKINLILSNWE